MVKLFAFAIMDAHVEQRSQGEDMRTGQLLFNSLPESVQNVIRWTPLDTFHKDMTITQIEEWMDNHLIFDGNKIVAVFAANQIIWEA